VTYQNDATMKEKADVLRNDQRLRQQQQGTTFSQFAQSEAAEPRGRFTQQEKSSVVGATPVPSYPVGNQWAAADQNNLEPPLGFSVGHHPAVGEPHEVQASIDQELGGVPPDGISSPILNVIDASPSEARARTVRASRHSSKQKG